MNIAQTVGRGIAWSTLSTVFAKFIIFLNVFIILNTLIVYEYGLAQLVLSVVSTVGIFLLPGLSSVILADLSAERSRGEFGKMKALFLQFFVLQIILGVFGWTLLFFFADVAAQLAGNAAIGTLLKIASFSLLVAPFRTVSQLLPGVELRYFEQSFYGNIEEIAKLAVLCVVFFVFHLGVYGLLLSIILSQFVTVLLYFPRSLSAYRVFGGAHVQDIYAFWHILRDHRKWGVANAYVGTLASTLQLWIIRLLLGTEAVGLFAFAEGIYGQVSGFLPLGGVLTPLLPRYVDQRAEFARYVRSAIKAQLLLCAPLIAATFVGLPILVLIFPKYGPAVPIIMWLIWAIVPSAVVSVYTPAFTALKEQYAYFWSNVWKAVLMIFFTILGMKLWGIPGMGIGMALFMTASMLERTWRLRQVLLEFRFPLREFFRIDRYERFLLRSLLAKWNVQRPNIEV